MERNEITEYKGFLILTNKEYRWVGCQRKHCSVHFTRDIYGNVMRSHSRVELKQFIRRDLNQLESFARAEGIAHG